MTKLFKTLLLVTAISFPAFAQQPTTKKATNRSSNIEATSKDMKKIAAAKMYVGTRAQAVNVLGLTEEETVGFSPIYQDYVNRKQDVQKRREMLIKEYADEMEEDDTAEDEENETADFVENFWETDIAMMELKKDMFDRFEDEIGVEKALDFFALEDMFIARAKRKMIMETVPTVRLYVPVPLSYEVDLNDFNLWKKVNIDGHVDVTHEFTYDGLQKLLNAAEAMTKAEGIEVKGFASTKKTIMMKAENMKLNTPGLKHAELARDAFTLTASVLGEIASESRFEIRTPWVNKLSITAKMIKPNVPLTHQASTVYTFFDTAEMIVNDLVEQINAMK